MIKLARSGILSRSFPFFVWLLFCGLILHSLHDQPLNLSFSLDAEQNCSLRVYYSSGASFQENLSHYDIVLPCRNKYDYSLPSTTRRISLVLRTSPGNRVTFRNFTLLRNQIFKNSAVNPGSEVLKPVRDIVADGTRFQVVGNRPELEVSPTFISARKLDIRLGSLIFLLFLSGSLIIGSCSLKDWNDLLGHLVLVVERLKIYCRENSRFLIYMFGCLILLFGYELFQLPITADDDYHLISQFEEKDNFMKGFFYLIGNSQQDVFISHGRWASALLYKLFTGFCPVLSLACTLFFLSALFLMMAEKMALPQSARYVLYPLFIAHPVFYQYYMFYMVDNTYGLCCMIVFLVAFYWLRCRDWRVKAILIFVSIFSVSALQSLIVIFPLWFLLDKMSDGLDKPVEYKKSFIELLKLCGFCLLVLLGYVLSMKYALWVFGVQWEYLDEYLLKPDSVKAVFRFIRLLLGKKMLSVFSGEFEFAIHGQLLLFLLMPIAVIVQLIRKKRSLPDILVMTVALAGILILPFALDIATFNTAIPVRSMVSLPLMLTGLCILGWRALEDCPKLRLTAGLLIVFVSIQYGILINQKAYASKLRYDQDRSVLQSIKDRCYQIPEFAANLNEKKKVPLAVVGNLIVPRRKAFPMWSPSMLNCSFEPAIVINMHLLGETYFYPVSTAEMKRVFPTAMSMPSWPAPGSVRYENGIMIVKLSDFNEDQCKQYDFPFRTVGADNSVHLLKKLPAPVKPVWSLNPDTLDSVQDCKVDFADGRVVVKPSGWHSLRSKAVKADPKKIYYLHLELQKNKRDGILYLGFSDPDRYGDETIVEIYLPGGEKQCILRVPGRLLNGVISAMLGDLHGKEQVFGKFVLLECVGPENLLAP